MSDEERLMRLEEAVAHQARTIEELSEALSDQWAAIDRMRLTVERLTERFDGLEETLGEAPPITRPPHY